ncbi:Beta-lactamase precursor [uncultured Eubacterium sp.]|nr:Beta-lactamase precursor [uncultured Eubacterium sp.]
MLKEQLIAYLKKENVQGAFLIKDLSDGETLCHNECLKVPSASLIKMYILVEAFRCIKIGSLTLDKEIAVKKEDLVDFSVLQFLRPRLYSLEELLSLMVVYSDNTATNVLVDYFGMASLNELMQQIGCRTSVIQRKMMDFAAAEEGRQNYTSVMDMTSLLERLYQGSLLGQPFDAQMLDIMKGQADEEAMRRDLPDELVIARKSGELDALDHDIAIVYTEKRNYIYVFFSWETGDNNCGRKVLAETSKLVFDYFQGK